MNHFKFFKNSILSISILGSLFVFSGCKEDFSDGEIRGVLTVDKSQYGNDKLEVNDVDSSMTRFIYQGRKILKIDQGLRSTDIIIYESGMVKLARIEIPTSLLNITKDKSFFVEGRKINQAWNIKTERVLKTVRKDYAGRNSSKPCSIGGLEGISGSVWEVTDFRYDYIIHFINEVTGKDIGTFVAKGETKTSAKKVDTQNKCFKNINIYETAEVF